MVPGGRWDQLFANVAERRSFGLSPIHGTFDALPVIFARSL